jgi:hypothetical protein
VVSLLSNGQGFNNVVIESDSTIAISLIGTWCWIFYLLIYFKVNYYYIMIKLINLFLTKS